MGKMTDEEARDLVAYNLRRLRGNRPYREIARACQTSAGAIRNIEMGTRHPGIGTVTRLAAYFGVSVEEFLRPKKKPKNAG